jgi:hypothetical protein
LEQNEVEGVLLEGGVLFLRASAMRARRSTKTREVEWLVWCEFVHRSSTGKKN